MNDYKFSNKYFLNMDDESDMDSEIQFFIINE